MSPKPKTPPKKKTPAKLGRPHGCTPERRRTVRDAILAGAPNMEAIAARAGVHVDSLYDWMARGKRARLSPKILERERPFAEFSEEVERAREEWALLQLASIQQAGLGYDADHVEEIWLPDPAAPVDAHGRPLLVNGQTPMVLARRVVHRKRQRSWQALAWLLKVRLPELYGDKLTLGLDVEEAAVVIANTLRGMLEELGIADRPEIPAMVRRHLTLVAPRPKELEP